VPQGGIAIDAPNRRRHRPHMVCRQRVRQRPYFVTEKLVMSHPNGDNAQKNGEQHQPESKSAIWWLRIRSGGRLPGYRHVHAGFSWVSATGRALTASGPPGCTAKPDRDKLGTG